MIFAMKKIAYVETIDSPAGPLAFAINEENALLRVKFVEGNYARTFEQELEQEGYLIKNDGNRTAEARSQLLEYTAGTRQHFDLPLALEGTEWQVAVWKALTEIPFGETRTYAQIAAMVGRPKAARAVGRANATNHIPVVVPCHRVIGADGSLTGFAGGTDLKTRLLEHERKISSRAKLLV